MTTYSSQSDGQISDDEIPYLHRRAAGGLGMVMTAACYVHPSGHAFDGQWSCSRDEDLPSLRRAFEAIHSGGSTAVLQIHHGGRMCPSRLCGTPLSASAVPPERPNAETPREMTVEEIHEIIDAFGQAARRAKEAGFDGVEIHGANTYLLQQFVSPHSNRRTDEWGPDDFRFPLAVVDAVLAAVGPNYPIGYRFSPEESETPGIRMERTERLVEALCRYPLSWLHVSLRDYRMPSLHRDFEGPTLDHLNRLIAGRVPFIGVGAVKTAAEAEDALRNCDLIALGRVGITEPEWPAIALAGGEPRRTIPAENAAEILTLPAGLETKIYAVPGWFEVDPKASSD